MKGKKESVGSMGVQVRVRVNDSESAIALSDGSRLSEVVASLGESPQTVLMLVNGSLAHPATVLKEGDFVELQSVIYGG